MLISELGIRGYKSFGNNEQILKLNTTEGELILLVGNNGNGKSSIIESFEFTIFGKVKSSKDKKWHTLSTLPNRINRELLNTIKFNSGGTDVVIKRGIGPNVLELWENNILSLKESKTLLDKEIEKYVGMDVESFKSFISLSINDFKNFMSLTTSEKQLLLDKLFNLEMINTLSTILKDIKSSNKNTIISLDSEIDALTRSIASIERSIKKSLEKKKVNLSDEISTIKQDMHDKKSEYIALKEKVSKIKEKEIFLNNENDRERIQLINLKNDIKNVMREIELYDSGKCPTCSTDFLSDHFVGLRGTLILKKESLMLIYKDIKTNMDSIKSKQVRLSSISKDTNKLFIDLTYLLKSYKEKIDELNKKQSISDEEDVDVSEFVKSVEELDKKRTKSSEYIAINQEKEIFYKELNSILGEDGVKRSIINSIIKPLNVFIEDNVEKMDLPFEVELDDTFRAKVKSLGYEIDHDSLSTGETKKINIAILIAYLKIIRTKKHINVLFLDEVFSSIDIDGIGSILELLRSFAKEYNINIFVVHHAVLNTDMFDRIIKINKEIFSTIDE